MKKAIWALALFGLMFAAANGAGASQDVRQSVLEMRYAQMECRANFMYASMGSAEDAGGNLSGDRRNMESAMTQLRAYAVSGDGAGFNQHMAQTQNAFSVAVRNIHGARAGALNAAGSCNGGDGGQGGQGQGGAPVSISPGCQARTQLLNQLRTRHDAANSEYAECMKSAVRGRVRAEVSEFKGWAARSRTAVSGMESRGYTVAGLNRIMNQAEAEADALEAEASSGTDADALLERRQGRLGKIFYLWAQFQQERIGLLLDRFQGRTSGYETEIAEIRAILANAASLGDDEAYTAEEAQESRRLVGVAAQQFGALVGEARGEE